MVAYIFNKSKSKTAVSFSGIIITLFCLLFVMSCTKPAKETAPTEKSGNNSIHQSYENGPASLTLDVDKKEMTIADRLNLTLSVTISEDYDVTMPSLGDKLDKFGIVDYHTSQPELVDKNKKKITRSYVLEPFLSGDYTIPVMEVKFRKTGAGESEEHSAKTSEVSIKVKSLLSSDIKDKKLNDIKPPVAYPADYRIWLWVASGIIGLAAIAYGIYFFLNRRKVIDAQAVLLTAHEIAYRDLDQLASEGFIERGEIKQFYYRISDILRRYIENRFGLRAPEQTTEEFLSGLDKDAAFPSEYKILLRTFLRNCDLVKFAQFKPEKEEVEKTFGSCRDFIKGTEEKGGASDAV
jgi:hypothetical protein